jgi:penicillin-binding protein 1C
MARLESGIHLSIPRSAALGAALLALAVAFTLGVRLISRPLEEIPWSTLVCDRNGNLLRLTLSADEKYRIRADVGELPPRFTEAILLKEDRGFFLHPGVNFPALARAAWHSYVRRDYRAGGSTITMQAARLLYHLDTDSVPGKAQQIFYALVLELAYPKKRILETYASLVPCGRNVEGFPAASLLYFRKPLAGLSLSEIFLLCSLPQRPNQDRDSDPIASLRASRDRLYQAWVATHPKDRELAVQFELPEALHLSIPFEAPHAVTSLLTARPGRTAIRSTIDVRLEKVLERILHGYVERHSSYGIRNACALLVRRRGMEVLAEIGSADFLSSGIDGQVNGTEARRSPGSALKPFLYALAMDQSIIHPMTVLKDAPIHFSGYNPDNFDNDFEGPVTAKDALIKSRNVPAVFLSQKVQRPDLYDFLSLAGVAQLRPKEDYGASIALGTAEVTMKELATLYGVLANGGALRPLAQTMDAPAPRAGRTLLSPQAAYLVLRILQEKPRPDDLGSGPLLARPRPVAWKTGTSIGFRDAWSVSIFDSFILCVWVGNFDGSGNPQFVGLQAAAPLMFEMVDALRAGGPARDYAADGAIEEPPGIITTKVCAVSGKIPGPLCSTLVDTLFIPGTSPIDVCDIHQQVFVDSRTGLRRSRPIPGVTRTEMFEVWPSDLLDLFEKAGLPRRRPPPFAPQDGLDAQASRGRAPEIASPLSRVEYAVRVGDPTYGEIPFIAVVPSDVTRVFWFLNESFVGQSAAKKAFFWKAEPGTWVLRATDEHGHSSFCRFTVVQRE